MPGQPDTIPLDSYELVEGRVLEAAEFDRRIFLNFGDDWKTDYDRHSVAPGQSSVPRPKRLTCKTLPDTGLGCVGG